MKYPTILLFALLLTSPVQAQYWESFGNTDQDVYCLYHDTIDNSLYIGGDFLWFDSLQAKGVVKWDGQTFSTLGDPPNQTYGIPSSTVDPVGSIIRYKGEIYCSMTNGAWNPGEIRGVARWDGVDWDSVAGIDGQVSELTVFKDELYIMGGYWERNDSIRSILKWDGQAWHDVGLQSWLGLPYIFINAATVFNGELYIGGNFWNPDESVMDVAKFDGTNWHPVAQGILGGFDDAVDLLVYKGELYVCGDFRVSSGNAGNMVMKLKDNEWVDVGGSFENGGGTAFKMLEYNGKLYVFGVFDNYAGGVPIHNIAIWDCERWCGLDHVFNNSIRGGEVYDGDLIIGGAWEYIDTQEIGGIARWTGGDHLDFCGAPVSPAVQVAPPQDLSPLPNPAQSSATLDLPRDISHATFTLNAITGQYVLSQRLTAGQNMVSLEGLPSGLYFYEVKDKERVLGTGKLVKVE